MKISMYNYSKLLTVFIFLFLLSFIAKSNWKDKLIKQAAIQYEKLDKANRLNDKKGKSNLNNYLIELDPNWVEERPNKLILSSNYNTIRDALVTFNSSRKDKLRFYVIVVNNYLGYLDESIDPAKLPDNITNLKDLLTSISKETDYKRMQDELSEIPAGIDQALTIKGYDERVIYFMGLVKLYRLDKIPRYYKQDFLSLKGGRLPENEEQIRTTCFKNVNTNISNLQVEQIVKGLIHSVEVVIDKKEVASENVKCAETLDELVEKTKAIKQSKLSETITGFASLLDNGSKGNQLGSPYLLVDDASNFESSDFFTKNILPDKLSLLATNSNYKLYVVFKKIDFVLNQEERKKLVEEVYKKSSKAKQSNTLLLVVPYYQTLCTGQSWLFGMPVNKSTGMLMPVVNGTDASLVSQMNTAITGIGTWSERFDNAFKNIPKNYTAYAFSFLYNGGLIPNGKLEETNVTGKENIIEVKLVEDERFDQLKEAYKDFSSTAQANAYPGTPEQTQNIIAAAEKYKATSDAILASPANFKAVSKLNLVSSKINEALALEFCKWYAVRKKFGAAAFFSSPENEIFYGGTNPLNVQDALVLIDIGSGISALVGWDAIFESIGAYYAFKNNLYTEASMYAGAAAVPFLSSAVRRGIMEGSTYMLKTVKGTYVTRPRNVLGCGYFFDIENNISPYLKNSIELKNFSTLTKYKAEKEFIEKLEEGLLKSEDHVALVNQNPTLIDEYNEYYKKEKGDWDTFLGKKGLNSSSEIKVTLKKLSTSSSVNISWKNIDDRNLIWASPNENKLSTAKSFANETGSNLYDAIFDREIYVKIDINDGRILLGNTNGSYQAFAVLGNAELSAFKSSVLNVSDDVFNTTLSNLIIESFNKLKVLSSGTSKIANIAGKPISLSSSKVSTFLGRFRPDIRNLFDEFGSFKNVGLGETPGGINLLNKPDHYYDASTWWTAYNKPWLNKAIDRGDDIYLATIPQKADDIIDGAGNLKGAFAEELNHLVSRNYKPKNLADNNWLEIRKWLGYKHPNWVEVLDIRKKILTRKSHVLEIESITTKANGQKGFTGCHSIVALDDFAAKNPGSKIEFRNKNLDITSGVYEAEPIIKMPNGDEYVKLNNNGKSTFFPDNWNEAKVLNEVEYAIQNNQGRFPSGAPNEYYGYSSDGKVKIHFYLNPNGNINSFFPSLSPI